MKTRLFAVLLTAILAVPAMTGCQAARTVESAGRAIERGAESVGDTLRQAVDTTAATVNRNDKNPTLTLERHRILRLNMPGFLPIR